MIRYPGSAGVKIIDKPGYETESVGFAMGGRGGRIAITYRYQRGLGVVGVGTDDRSACED